MALPLLDPDDPDATGRHLLALPADIGHDEVETLAISRFARATWEVVPTTAAPRATGGARGLRTPHAAPGVLRLSRHSTLHGPYTVDRGIATTLGLPTAAGQAYLLHAPVERGDKPWPGGGDRDGLARAFPDGLPVRDEERVVTWLLAAARRLGGAVRTAPVHGGVPALLIPDPAAAVDLTVYTDIWLEPEAALTVMRQAVPRAQLNLPAVPWAGPPPGTGQQVVPGTESMDGVRRRDLHRRADDHDIEALTNAAPMNAYAVIADLDLDGIISLEIGGETTLPPMIAALPWASQGAVTYRVRWEPADVEELEAERPSFSHRVARGRASPLVIAVTRAVHRAVAGEIADAMDFLVDPADLQA
ncbi:hypothetical protein [Actinotalea sp. K2]|uniref:hypothetical protein n=1 Tax=Actinotalea sp. K2 TaxID=2939438 RepID=UPI00201704A2|nr:hypothetical protein [Actinotalea sp. K2]MCL3861757.1 hypothetical protein [Actinotalea sp. K2]